MATVLLQSVGSVAGGALGGSMGAWLGRMGGSLLGSMIDQSVLGTKTSAQRGPRLETMPAISCEEGAAIPRLYGRMKIGGQIIWATRFEEQASTSRVSSGGKLSQRNAAKTTTTYQYSANFAVGLCEGPIAEVRRIWADGHELDQSLYEIRVYRGDEEQVADPLISAKEGSIAPAFRGLAYVVFERFPLADFSNRIPQLSFEVIKPIEGLASRIRGVNIIPGSTEFGYSVQPVITANQGTTTYENRHQLIAVSDWVASIDSLQALCPNLKSVALVVAWFGDDLRAEYCSLAPRVERASKQLRAEDWSVAGLARPDARLVSRINDKPAFGGTPSDASVLAAIRDLKRRGLSVILSPFVMMDIPPDNLLPDPWQPNQTQPAYPWRGRVTCFPAPGVEGSPWGTHLAGQQVKAFFGSRDPDRDEWRYRRFILHYADLCQRAGGVDAFLLGSELVALTLVHDGQGDPAAETLKELAQDVRTILGPKTRLSYAADWTEYGARTLDGTTVRFPLDVLWGDPNIDFIGVDFYVPLSDWRDGSEHLDGAIASSVYDLGYLQSRVTSGEAFDWYYADKDDRDVQKRRPISDGAYGETWMFRQKDLSGWWSHHHYHRSNGLRSDDATAWVPRSKPVWLIECGCPAVDRGSNAPNVFLDEKSSQSAVPYHSRATRDDFIQDVALCAILDVYGTPSHEANPPSPIYGGAMVDPDRVHIWAWDARPFPAFPHLSSLWADAGNWSRGHWLNGRLESPRLDGLLTSIWEAYGVPMPAFETELPIHVSGFCIDRVMSLRDAVEPLASFFRFDVVNDQKISRIVSGRSRKVSHLDDEDLVELDETNMFEATRAHDNEIANVAEVGFCNADDDYRKSALKVARGSPERPRVIKLDVPLVLTPAAAEKFTQDYLQDLWIGRESIRFKVRPAALALQVGDIVTHAKFPSGRHYQIDRILDEGVRSISARAVDPDIFSSVLRSSASQSMAAPRLAVMPKAYLLELATSVDTPETLLFGAVFARPWLGPVGFWRMSGDVPVLVGLASQPAIMGRLSADLPAAGSHLFQRGLHAVVDLDHGALETVSTDAVLDGRNRAAIQHNDGSWEMIAFATANLVSKNAYALSTMLRGIGGNSYLAGRRVNAGAAFVLLDESVIPLVSDISQIGLQTRWRVGLGSLGPASFTVSELNSLVKGAALKPWSPVHLSARRRTGRHIEINFLRRSRVIMEAWDLQDLPLGEALERYELDIVSQGKILRTLVSSAPHFVYGLDDEIADFGSQQSRLTIHLYQVSAMVGRGFALTNDIFIS